MRLFITRMPDNGPIIDQEGEKFFLYGAKIGTEEAAALSVRTLDDNVFDLCDALCVHDIKKAFRLWKDLDAGQLDPIYLIATLAAQFRFLFPVRTLMGEGGTQAAIAQRLHALSLIHILRCPP